MNISFWTVGKANEAYIKQGVDEFTKRASRYFKTDWKFITPPKNAGKMSEAEQKKKEGEIILQELQNDDCLIVLDEKGKQLNSEELSSLIQSRANASTRRLVFLVGGAYGIDKEVLQRAHYIWSLSALTFPHQLVRLILAEQVYRACSILKNEKYHHK